MIGSAFSLLSLVAPRTAAPLRATATLGTEGLLASAPVAAALVASALTLLGCSGASPSPDLPSSGGAPSNGGATAGSTGGTPSSGSASGTGENGAVINCPPAPDVATVCPEAFDGSVPGAPAKVGPLGLIPVPSEVELGRGNITLDENSRIVAPSTATALANLLAAQLRVSTGLPLPVSTNCGSGNDIVLNQNPSLALPDEGYELSVECSRATIHARTEAGLFYGVQTLRELFPTAAFASSEQKGFSWTLPRVRVADSPRFAWRGFMLDVARHFFSTDEIKRLLDLAALHKLNRFHLHLSDDQGWRIQIDSWPNLTSTGSQSQAGGGPGGFYTKAQFKELNEYALKRFITIVPEVDMPGHTNAALASYPKELTSTGSPPKDWPYTGVEVGFSSLWIGGPNTETFVSDVIAELAAMTPGRYLHIGGDEAHSTSLSDYKAFLASAKGIVESHGKTLVGWSEIGRAPLGSSPIAQHWNDTAIDNTLAAQSQGMKLILSPAQRTYLDMKYSDQTPIGQDWAGLVSVEQAYNFEPSSAQIPEASILGIEAALWTESVATRNDIDYLVFPRLAGHAEIGWSKKNGRNYSEYKDRLVLHGARLRTLGVHFFESPDIAW